MHPMVPKRQPPAAVTPRPLTQLQNREAVTIETGQSIGFVLSIALCYAWKLDPQPQELVALGFLKTNPRPMTSSRKSISVPSR